MILPLLLACTPPDLPEEWQLDRLRLLAVRADPAEPRPGDVVTFTSLAYVPDDAEWSSVWFACLDGDAAGCALDPDLLDQLQHADELAPADLLALLQALREAGFVGAQPGMDLQWFVPADALAALSDADALEGLSATVSISLATDDDTELTLKRVPVSLATTPNHNPDVAPLEIDGTPVEADAAVVLDPGQDYRLHAALDGAPEDYTYVTTEGVTETRTESPAWRWYTSGGTLAEDDGDAAPTFGDDGASDSTYTWTTPDDAGTYTLAAVVLDGRGGMGWQSLAITVR